MFYALDVLTVDTPKGMKGTDMAPEHLALYKKVIFNRHDLFCESVRNFYKRRNGEPLFAEARP